MIESQILALFDNSPLHQFSKFNNFLWVCWFLGKNLPNFVPPQENSRIRIAIKVKHESFDLNNVEVIDDLNINRWLMRIMRLGASYVSTGSNGYRSTGSVSSSSSGSKSRRLSIADTSASNLLRPPNTSRGRRFSDSMNFDADVPWVKLQKPVPRKGGYTNTLWLKVS